MTKTWTRVQQKDNQIPCIKFDNILLLLYVYQKKKRQNIIIYYTWIVRYCCNLCEGNGVSRCSSIPKMDFLFSSVGSCLKNSSVSVSSSHFLFLGGASNSDGTSAIGVSAKALWKETIASFQYWREWAKCVMSLRWLYSRWQNLGGGSVKIGGLYLCTCELWHAFQLGYPFIVHIFTS